MDYSKMKSSIDRAILKSPLDVAAYDRTHGLWLSCSFSYG